MKRWIALPCLALVTTGTAACDLLFDETTGVYDGPSLVEFAPVLPDGSYTRTVAFAAGSTETQSVMVRVQYIAAPPATDLTGEFAVAEGTTAAEDVHYTLPGGTSYQVAAGQNVGEFQVDLLGAGLADGESVVLMLELVDGAEFDVSENYKSFAIVAQKAAP